MWVFTHFWRFLAIFGQIWGFGAPRRGGFTSTPRGGALYPDFWVFAGGGPRGLFWRDFPAGRENGLPGTPGSGTGRRAPARGVDVKPPPRARSGTGQGPPGPCGSWGPRLPGLPGSPGGGLPGEGTPVPVPGTWSRSRIRDDPAPGVVLHQPLAAGPCPRPAASASRRGLVAHATRSSRPPRPRG